MDGRTDGRWRLLAVTGGYHWLPVVTGRPGPRGYERLPAVTGSCRRLPAVLAGCCGFSSYRRLRLVTARPNNRPTDRLTKDTQTDGRTDIQTDMHRELGKEYWRVNDGGKDRGARWYVVLTVALLCTRKPPSNMCIVQKGALNFALRRNSFRRMNSHGPLPCDRSIVF